MIRALLIILLFPALCLAQISGTVVGVHDGDTFTMLTKDKQQIKVRVKSIDCPETGQPYGKAAKQYTSAAIFGKMVTLTDTDKDRYGRTLAVVVLPDGSKLHELLLQSGYAWHYKKYDNSYALAELEHEAKRKRAGLWQSEASPPWEWRKSKSLKAKNRL